jgi:ectoine hydroxylase-related dioxygenase (phytanoyl-CoA dioxygenase family)
MAPFAAKNHLVTEFHERGFVVVPDALSLSEVRALNEAIDGYLADYPEDWVQFDTMRQTVDVLPRVTDFDRTIENPRILDLVRAVLGDDLTFEEFSIMLRDPTEHVSDIKGWHRDIVRTYERRHEIEAISVVYYLTDVTADDHCFSIIPGSHGARLDLRPEDVAPGMEEDVLAPAGSALVFHARCLHAGRLKPRARQRRTLHLYYDRFGFPRTSEWTTIPARLGTKNDPALPPHLYAKWNVRETVDGTGRKPRDVDPALSTAELLRIVQERANRKVGSERRVSTT